MDNVASLAGPRWPAPLDSYVVYADGGDAVAASRTGVR
jgi:hypothetical protein